MTDTLPKSTSPVRDILQRPLRDLRISVTDRCNFRCTYCMPREIFGAGYAFLEREEILSFEEITRFARIAAGLGVHKLRITGGEPLVRRELPKLIAQLAGIDGIDDICMTSNAALLTPAMAERLRDAGLKRMTLSLDALDDETFHRVADVRIPVQRVLDGIEHAVAAGLGPVKVNMVVIRGVNDHQIEAMAEHFAGSAVVLRFIEFMDVGNSNGWKMDQVLPHDEIVARIDAVRPIEALPANHPGETATRWRYRDGSGEIGVIASVTKPFCGDCSRLRLSAEGQLFTCLFASEGHDLRSLLRSGADDDAVTAFLQQLWQKRRDRYSEIRGEAGSRTRKVEMSYIGG